MERKRESSRIDLFFSAELRLPSGKKIKSSAGAINMHGVFFVGGINIKKGDNCDVSVWLSEDEKVDAKGIVRRMASDGVGVEFLELVGRESFLNLKSIVERNSKNQHYFLEELEALKISENRLNPDR